MSRILVTGGTGFVGGHLVNRLLDLGHEVVLLARKPDEKPSAVTSSFIKALRMAKGDILNPHSIVEAARGCDTIFHLAGLVAYKKADREQMEKVNVTGTQNVLTACRELRTPNLVFMSSVVAVGASFTPDHVLNENSDFNLTALNLGYLETKRAAEKLILSPGFEKQTRIIIVNPSTIYGPADALKGSRRTQVKVAQGKFPFFTAGGVSVVDIDDVIDGILLAWKNGKSGERYILSGDNITIEQLFRLIAEAAHVKAPSIRLPNFLLHGLGTLGDFKSGLGMSSSLSRENAWTATMYHWFDNGKAKRELGFRSRPARESIEKSVAWMKQNGMLD